jgi:Nif-specific regulatory protein
MPNSPRAGSRAHELRGNGLRSGAPDLAALERTIGDVLIEGEVARTPRAAIYRIRAGSHPEGPIALKVALNPGTAEDLAQFRHEVRLLTEVRHPNVVQVYDFGILPGDFPFLTMELLEPADLAAELARGGWPLFYEIAIQAASGLAHIHRHGVLHLDLKPDNLGLVRAAAAGGELQLKILDFGLSQSLHGPLDRRIRGTLAYAAPEMLLQDAYDQRADLYSLGMTFLELATGALPSAGDELAAMRFHLEAPVPDPLSLRPDLPKELAAILTRLLQRDPGQRFPSAGKLAAELARAAGRQLAAAELWPTEGTLLASRMVGRGEALDGLRQDLAAAARGEGRLVLIEGAEGMGKSRLLREFRLLAALGGATVGIGRSRPGLAEPLRPLLEAFDAVGFDAQLEGAKECWGEAQDRYRLYQKIAARLAERTSSGPPLVIAVEDVHLAEREVAELLAYLAAEVAGRRLLLIATREGAPSGTAVPAPAGEPAEGESSDPLQAASDARRIVLGRLDLAETTALVDAALGTEQLPLQLHEWLQQRSKGTPGRVAPLLRRLIAERILRFRDGEWKPSLGALGKLGGLATAAEVTRAEPAASLAVAERDALAAAAIIGEPWTLPEFTELLAVDADQAYDLLRTLVAEGFLDAWPDAQGTRYSFHDAAARAERYAALDGRRRESLHARFAARLKRLQAGGAEVAAGLLAEHLWRGGRRRESLPHLLQAADALAAAHGYREAAALYARAAEVAEEAAEPATAWRARTAQADSLSAAGQYARAIKLYREAVTGGPDRRLEDRRTRARLWLKAGRLHQQLGQHEGALEAFEAGLGLVAEAADPELEVDLLHGKAWALTDRGDAEAGFAAARAALRQAGRQRLEAQRANLLNSLGLFFYTRGDWRRAGRLVRRGLAVAERVADERQVVKLRNNLGNVLWKTGDYGGAIARYRENLTVCEASHDLWGQLTALNNLGIMNCALGDWRAARGFLERSLDMKRRLGAREAEALARLNLGEVEEVLGDWPRARRHLDRVLKILVEHPEHTDRVEAVAQLAALARKRGAYAEAEALAGEALELAERTGDRDLLSHCHYHRGLVDRDRENWAAAKAHLETALEMAIAADTREALARLYHALADLAIRRGEPTAAVGHAAEAMRWARQLEDRLELGKAVVLEGRLAGERGEAELAEQRFAAGVQILEQIPAPYEYARSVYEWALRTRDAELAEDRLKRALATFETLGAVADTERVRGAVEQARERRREERERRGTRGLYEVGKVINSTLDLNEVLARTMDIVVERLRAERGMIVFSDQLTGDLDVVADRNLASGGFPDEGRRLSESVVRRVIEKREPVIAVDAQNDPRFAGAASIVASHIVSILCVPLAIRERLVGAIYVDHRRSRQLFGERDKEFLVAFADLAAGAIENARLYGEIQAARERLKAENESLRKEILSSRHLSALVGKSRAVVELKIMLERVAQSTSTVLIRGESGTGKGLVARLLHSASPRRSGPFIQFNCAALPETLVESELFGHEKGAFTGAVGMKPGRFELANGGTIFIDEIGKVSPAVQSKLLRVVEDKEFERVGGTKTLKVDSRIVTATNLNLEEAITRGEFREDLYYRLNIIPMVLPPLRERREDVPYLVQHFLQKISRDLGLPPKELAPGVLEMFLRHRWPGNIRELEAAIHRALVLAHGETLTRADFAWMGGDEVAAQVPERPAAAASLGGEGSYEERMEALDRQLLAQALEQAGGRIREAARVLGIARNTLKAKMKKYGLAGEG